MKNLYNQIIQQLNQKGSQLGMSASNISYTVVDDPGEPVEGYTTSGTRETIDIPGAYMKTSGASNASEFLAWLQKQ